MNKEEFVEECKRINIFLTPDQLEKLNKFYHLMLEWNQKINLTRITEEKEVYLKHFYDSLTLNKVVDLKKITTLCDVGTGAGFPGIVLKIVFPNIKITLIDSLQKRINYLNEIIKELNLDNIEKLTKYTMHLVSKNGIFVAMKGKIENELTQEVRKKINKKYKIVKEEKFLLPMENSERTLLIIKNK